MNHAQTVEALKALADETRLSIIRYLVKQDGPVSSCDIVASCASFHKLSQPAMSHHFGRLVDAGIVKSDKRGTQRVYLLDLETLSDLGINPHKL